MLYVLINLPQRVLNDPAASELSSRLSCYSSRPATAEMLQIGNAKLGVYKRVRKIGILCCSSSDAL